MTGDVYPARRASELQPHATAAAYLLPICGKPAIRPATLAKYDELVANGKPLTKGDHNILSFVNTQAYYTNTGGRLAQRIARVYAAKEEMARLPVENISFRLLAKAEALEDACVEKLRMYLGDETYNLWNLTLGHLLEKITPNEAEQCYALIEWSSQQGFGQQRLNQICQTLTALGLANPGGTLYRPDLVFGNCTIPTGALSDLTTSGCWSQQLTNGKTWSYGVDLSFDGKTPAMDARFLFVGSHPNFAYKPSSLPISAEEFQELAEAMCKKAKAGPLRDIDPIPVHLNKGLVLHAVPFGSLPRCIRIPRRAKDSAPISGFLQGHRPRTGFVRQELGNY